jgi:hypothetical protein
MCSSLLTVGLRSFKRFEQIGRIDAAMKEMTLEQLAQNLPAAIDSGKPRGC